MSKRPDTFALSASLIRNRVAPLLRAPFIVLAFAIVIGQTPAVLAGPSLTVRAGVPLTYAEQPVRDVNDRNFNRFWADKINFVDWSSAKPARIYSSTFSLPDGRKLTATMLGGNNDCDLDACPLRLFDGNAQIGELVVCEDISRHQLTEDRLSLLTCGESHNLLKATAKGVAESRNAERTMLHNGSVVSIMRERGDMVAIRYLELRRGLPSWMKGQLLFLGTESRTHQFTGTAYTFKGGCPPAAYDVTGALDANGELVLTGQAPVRDQRSCAVLGYTTQSANARLLFANILPPD
jgi:hypothetical protein